MRFNRVVRRTPFLAGEAEEDRVIIVAAVRLLLSHGVTDHLVVLGQHRGGGEPQESQGQVWPSLLPCRRRPQQRLWEEGGSPQTLYPLRIPGGTLGPEHRTRPVGGPSPPLLPGPRPELCPEQRVVETCLLSRLFAPSGWKASQRAPQPQPRLPGDIGEGRRARGLSGLCPRRGPEWGARPVGARRRPGSSVGPGPRAGGGHCRRGPSGGLGRPGARPHLSRRETWPRGASARPAPFSRRVRGSLLPPSPLSAKGQSGSAPGSALRLPGPTPSANCPFSPLPAFLSSLDG